MADSIEQLAYELSVQTLAEQERSVSGLRARAGTVLAAASISASFLGTKTSQGSGLDAWSVLALGAFALTFAASIWVLWPRVLTFAFEGRSLLGASDEKGGVDVAQGYRAAVIWMGPPIDENRDAIEDLSWWFSASCVLLALEVVLWTISLA